MRGNTREVLVTLAGTLLVVAGVMLPWLTLFAGLTTYSGLAGRNGRIVLVGAMAAALCALVALVRPHSSIGSLTRALGALLTGYSVWLLVGVETLARRGAANPMLLSRVGPGLFVILFGALLIVVAPFASRAGAPVRP